MLELKHIKKIELEITSDCNAACPGCARTQNLDLLKIDSFSLQDLQRMFPTKQHIENKFFKFCGVLGDPVKNKDALAMTEYIVKNNGSCQWSTNAAYQNVDWWTTLGKISAESKRVDVNFCIDGHEETNHIYRVNTNWKILNRNIEAYSSAGGRGQWVYIVFDHNEYEIDKAKEHADRLGFDFQIRTGMRNSYSDWVAKLGKKNNKVSKKITTTGDKQHSKLEKHKEIRNFIDNYSENKEVDKEKSNAIIKSVTCKLLHEAELFIASDQTLWPCCFLWDSAFKNKDGILDKFVMFDKNWNSLKHHTVDEILQHEWFTELLEKSWNPEHNLHIKRCLYSCAYNKAYQNEFKKYENETA